MKKIGTIYKGKSETKNVIFNRVWSMPNHWTFKIRPIASLLERYVPAGKNKWIDPFAGTSLLATIRNDHNPETVRNYEHTHCMEALEFAKSIKGKYEGILFDPPYSFRQISEHYKTLGMKATQIQTSMAFYERVKSALCEKIKKGGYVISFGWNSNGFGKARGFEIIEIMLVAHGGSKNDTIVTVEKKVI